MSKNIAVKAVIIAGIVIAIIAAGFVATGFYVSKLDTVFPNVSVGGEKLAGLTIEEAQRALIDAGYEDSTSKVAVTVNFPDGGKMSISGEESGVKLMAKNAAELAYRYGRNGSFFANELCYIKGIFMKVELDRSGTASINEEYVRSIIDDYANAFNEESMKDAYTINSDCVMVVKGSGGALADPDGLYELVVTAFAQSVSENRPITVDYVMSSKENNMDFQSIYNQIFIEPVSAVYDDSAYEITQSVTGVSFDIEAAQKAYNEANVGETVTIPLIYTEPEVATETLQQLLFRDILSERKTYVSGTSNRKHNVSLAAAAINGKILNPGETFSYNNTLGERTTEKGYKSAGAYVGGKVVDEVGGGICQVSSTLYCCVLYADLEVVDRSNHMFIVTYLPLGNDATVNWGTIDFKFKNNTEYPIRIEAFTEDGYLTIRLHGTKNNTNYIDVEYVVISTKPYEVIEKEDPSVEPDTTKTESSGHTGYVVDTYKYIYDENDNLLSKEFIARSNYRSQNKVILVPIVTPSPSPSPSQSESPSPSESPSASPSPSPSDPTETPSASPTPSPSPSPPPSPAESAEPSPTASPSE